MQILAKNLNFSAFMKSHTPTTPINRAFQKSGFSKVVRVYFENQQNNFCSKTQNFFFEIQKTFFCKKLKKKISKTEKFEIEKK